MKLKMYCRKAISLIVTLSLVLTTCFVVVVSAEDGTAVSPYKNFVIFGDSLCLGFSTAQSDMTDADTFDIIKNATLNRYPHSYPSVFAKRMGLDIDASDDGHTDLYNLGICAAWSGDIYKLLSDPFYQYDYNFDNFDKNTMFTLPKDYNGKRAVVDTEADGYDVGNPATWVYKETDEYGMPMGEEDFMIPAGTPIHVAYELDYGDWGKWTIFNPVIESSYLYVSRNCVDKDGKYIDTNNDGKVDDDDIIYYPTVLNDWGSYEPSSDASVKAQYGEYFRNPLWSNYFYDFATDKVINGDLIALATGGNDVYHSFMPYQQNSGTTLGNLVYYLSYMLQMGGTIGDIAEMFTPENSWMLDMMLNPDGTGNSDWGNTDWSETPDWSGMGAGAGAGIGAASLMGADEITKLIEYYSKENINEYFKDVLADYKSNLEKTIVRMNELRQPTSELVLMSHFNPFGMQNYLEMLSRNLQNGKLCDNVSTDVKSIVALLQALIGSPSDYEEFGKLTPKEQEQAQAQMGLDLSAIIQKIKANPDITDAEITQMFTDLSYPLMVMLAGEGLSDVYAEMNKYVKEMAEKYDLVYVDISGAPSSGRYDPHPSADGHQWIADKLYEAVNPTITASISCCGTGKGKISNEGTTTLRLRDTMEYRIVPATGSKIAAIFIDGQLLDPVEYADVYNSGVYVFDNIKESHKICVQFDYAKDFAPKYCVDVLGGYAAVKGGEGLYAPGTKVKIDAGEIDGYVFTGWVGDNVEFDDPFSPQTSFIMPNTDVRVIATWRPADDQENPQPQYNTIKFDPQCDDITIDEITALEGTIINVDDVEVPEREGYVFDGWYYDEDMTIRVHQLPINANATLYAKWIKEEDLSKPLPQITAAVSPLSTGYGTISSLGTTPVEYGGFKEYKMIPDDDSYISAVFVDGIYLNPFDPATRQVYTTGLYVFDDVKSNHAIVVQFTNIGDGLPRYVVDVLGSYVPHSAGEGLYIEGDIVNIDAGTLNGYVFDGWETDDDIEIANPSSPKTWFFMPDKNVSVKAKWRPLYYLTFDTNGGTPIDRVLFPKDTVLDLDDYTTDRDNFHFAGWYSDKEFKNPVDEHDFKGNDVIYAKWQSILSFETLGGSTIEDIIGDEGTTLDVTKYVPTKDGYTFMGWYADTDFETLVEKYKFAGDTTLYAKWVVNSKKSPLTGEIFNKQVPIVWLSIIGCAVVCLFCFKNTFKELLSDSE